MFDTNAAMHSEVMLEVLFCNADTHDPCWGVALSKVPFSFTSSFTRRREFQPG